MDKYLEQSNVKNNNNLFLKRIIPKIVNNSFKTIQ